MAVIFGALGALTVSARADDFYKTHKITFGVPNGAGGGYDTYARALARHLGKHIPGHPTVVVQNVPAAGGVVLANQAYTTAPRDGSYIAMIRGTVVHAQVFQISQVRFDARKFAWLGNQNRDHDTCVVGGWTGISGVEALYKRQVVVGASGTGAQAYTYPTVYRDLLGMKLKVLTGYPTSGERMLAVERHELDGFCGVTISTFRSQLSDEQKSGKIKLIAQAGLEKDPRYPDVPNILDQAKTPEQRLALKFLFIPLAIGRALAAPPDTPAERVTLLRNAIWQTMHDPDYLAEAKKLRFDTDSIDATETARIVNELFTTPPKIVAQIKSMIAP